MSHLITSLAWCWLQLLVVAAAAICLSLLTLRRSPATGATIAWSGILAALILTALAFVPLPAPIGHRALSGLVASHLPNLQPPTSLPQQQSQSQLAAPDAPGSWATLDGSRLLQFLKSLRVSDAAVVRQYRAAHWALAILALGFMIGLLRLLRGLIAIAALRRRSTAAADSRVADLITDLMPRLSLRHLPHVRQSHDVDSAAVIGWWRPTVLLPADWRDWSSPELKAVLAHELAHIARRDAPWRLIAAFLVALHWGQPLMHWLRRHLLLAQELAADELAAAVIGSKQEYLQALARLALRQDNRHTPAPPAALVPVFSGFLLRRIVMLRAKDGSLHRNWRLLAQGSALGLVATVTLLATAIRGLADRPEPQRDDSIRVAKATDAKPTTPAAAALFQRPPFNLARLAFSKQGGFLVRLGEILNQPRFATAARKGDEWLVKHWFPGADAPPCSLKDIEYVAGDFMLSARYVTPPQGEQDPHPHQVLFGSQCGFIRLRKPVAEVFAWLKQTPGAQVKQLGDVSYVALTIAALGPMNTCFYRVDDHTLLWANGESVMQKRLEQLATANDLPSWHIAWKKVDGGLLTAVAAEAEYKNPPENIVDETDKLTREFFSKTRLKAIGADWQPHTRGNTSFKLQFGFDSEADARSLEVEIRHAIDRYLQLAREGMQKATKEKDRAFGSDMIAMLEQARVELRPTENGWQIEVQLSGPADIESNL